MPGPRRNYRHNSCISHVAAGRHFPSSFSASDNPASPDCSRIHHPNPSCFRIQSPLIALSGVVDYDMYEKFRKQFDKASDQALVVIELSTLGGDPEVARMMGEDVRFASEMEPGAAVRISRQGCDLFRRHYLHEFLRARKPLSHTRHAADDP